MVKEAKKLALSIGFFHILLWECILMLEVVMVQTIFKANITRNAIFEKSYVHIFARLGSKMLKNNYLEEFYCSWSVLKSQN